MVGHAFKQVAVVADNNQSAREGIQQVFHCCQSIRIQIVRRLVKKKNIRFSHEQAHELQTSPLATGNLGNPGPCTLSGKAHPLSHLRGRDFLAVNDHAVRNLIDGLDNAHIRKIIKLVGILRKRGNLNGLSTLDAPASWFQISSKQIENRRFSRAIHTDYTDSLAGSEAPRHMVKNGALTTFWSWEGDGNVLEVQHVFPEACGRHFHQLDTVPGRGNVSN